MSDAFYAGLATWSQIVASLLFIAALVYLWVRFIAPAVVASQARKNAELQEAERRRDGARAEVEVAQGETAAAEGEVRSIRQRAESDARRIHDQILADAKAEGERLIRTADGELERARTAARDSYRTELLERAMRIARVAASRLGDRENDRLVVGAVEVAERSEPASTPGGRN